MSQRAAILVSTATRLEAVLGLHHGLRSSGEVLADLQANNRLAGQ
jgi:hypothetical protein